MGTVAKVLLISLLVVAGQVTAQPTANALDEATRREAEATLALVRKEVAWGAASCLVRLAGIEPTTFSFGG